MPIINTTLTLKDLPSPPPEKSGWPWIKQSEPLPQRMPDGSEWPLISIITPSYNQGQFIEETIRSVLLQGYPNLEYIIIDGGSTDNSVEIIQKYEPWLTYWVSRPDNGQADAIQRGFDLSNGVVWNWLNSDDLLDPDALQVIAIAYHNNPYATTYGGKMTSFGIITPYVHHKRFHNLYELVCVWEEWPNPQPAIFLSSNACREVNGLNVSLHYTMDYDLYLRLAILPAFQAQLIDEFIARDRWHHATKTVSQYFAFKRELIKVFDEFVNDFPSLLPKQWRKSRARYDYHLALDLAKDTGGERNDLYSFIRISLRYAWYIWDYRFFWAVLIRKILGFRRVQGSGFREHDFSLL